MGEFVALDRAATARRNREDWRMALLVVTLRNMFRDSKTPAISVEDLMPWLRTDPTAERPADRRRQTPEEMRAILEVITIAMGGEILPREAKKAAV
jgi:hypothetical protein